jgi:hypothetical protein
MAMLHTGGLGAYACPGGYTLPPLPADGTLPFRECLDTAGRALADVKVFTSSGGGLECVGCGCPEAKCKPWETLPEPLRFIAGGLSMCFSPSNIAGAGLALPVCYPFWAAGALVLWLLFKGKK